MLPKKYKLNGFNTSQLLKKGNIAKLRYGNIYWGKNSACQLRAAVIISRKLKFGAVVRSRIKRRVYAALEKTYLLETSLLIAVLIKNDKIVKDRFSTLCQEIEKSLKTLSPKKSF